MICKLWYFNFFLCNLDSFYLFFFSLLCLGISILYWIKIVKQYPCLVPWRKYFQLFTVECDINIGLSYIAFLLLRYVPSLGNFVPQLCWEVFIVNWILHMVKSFFCICSHNHMLCILWFPNVVCHINWFANTDPSLHPWEKSYLIPLYDPFNILLNLDY